MKIRLIIFLAFLHLLTFAQSGITFKIEHLSKPEKALWLTSPNQVYRNLILSDVNLSEFEVKKDSIDFPFNIIAKSHIQDSLVTFGYHSFFNGMYQAYADHRPFVLSPDMIWLLISQGFARHVNSNHEQLRQYFVDFKGKATLIVKNDSISLDNPNSPWERVFPEFTSQISKYTGDDSGFINIENMPGIQIRSESFPKELLELDHIKSIEIQFIDKIVIPDEISQIKIDLLILSGSITQNEIERICRLLPNTKLLINKKTYNTR